MTNNSFQKLNVFQMLSLMNESLRKASIFDCFSLKVLTGVLVVEVVRLTPGSRRWSWRRSFTSITTWPDEGESRLLTRSVWQVFKLTHLIVSTNVENRRNYIAKYFNFSIKVWTNQTLAFYVSTPPFLQFRIPILTMFRLR